MITRERLTCARLCVAAMLTAAGCSDPASNTPAAGKSQTNDTSLEGGGASKANPGVGAGKPAAGDPGGGGTEGNPELPLASGGSTAPLEPGSGAAAGAAPDLPLAEPNGFARNPIISHIFTADPSAHVFDGRVYVYTSHDLDEQTVYEMTDYHAFSSEDLVNWQDHGVVLDAVNIAWTSKLFAPGAAYGAATGKYYLYFPNEGSAIGVAVSDSPAGPFEDALGQPLVDRNVPGAGDVDWLFDPMAFVDDDGQTYLYFGGGPQDTGDNARVIRLNPDMISLADAGATTIPAPDFFEASHVHQRDGRYYFSYSTSFANHPAFIDYLVSDDPVSGWQYAGTILPQPAQNNDSNNHQSIIELGGSSYIFYHNRVLANREGRTSFQRSITLDNLSYDAQGNINPVPAQQGVVRQLRSLDAFARLQAEAVADQRGSETQFAEDGSERLGVSVTELQNGDWLGYSQVDFGSGATLFRARIAARAGGELVVRVDGCGEFTSNPGTEVGRCQVSAGEGPSSWTDVECSVTGSPGVHDVCLSVAGPEGTQLFDLDYFSFE